MRDGSTRWREDGGVGTPTPASEHLNTDAGGNPWLGILHQPYPLRRSQWEGCAAAFAQSGAVLASVGYANPDIMRVAPGQVVHVLHHWCADRPSGACSGAGEPVAGCGAVTASDISGRIRGTRYAEHGPGVRSAADLFRRAGQPLLFCAGRQRGLHNHRHYGGDAL